MKKTINVSIIIICTSLIVFLLVITFQAISLNDNWQWSIDFEDKKNTINSFGSLSAAVITLLSTILLIYTIHTQLRQFRKQNKQFDKQFALQKDQFEEEKKRAESEERRDMFFKLQLVDSLLISFIRHLKIMSKEIKSYFEYEKANPLLHIHLQFNVNRDAERLNKMESLSLLKAFQFYFENTNKDWVVIFTEIFSLLTFYDDLLKEMAHNNKNHVKEKYDSKVEVSFDLNNIMETAKKIALRYRIDPMFRDLPYYGDIENLVSNYNRYLEQLNGEESNINDISQNILLPFLEAVIPLIKSPEQDKYGMIELINMVSIIRKRIYFIRSTATIYSSNMEKRYDEYFSDSSAHLKELEKLQKLLHEKINSLNLNEL